jgi:hypothetical protein
MKLLLRFKRVTRDKKRVWAVSVYEDLRTDDEGELLSVGGKKIYFFDDIPKRVLGVRFCDGSKEEAAEEVGREFFEGPRFSQKPLNDFNMSKKGGE